MHETAGKPESPGVPTDRYRTASALRQRQPGSPRKKGSQGWFLKRIIGKGFNTWRVATGVRPFLSLWPIWLRALLPIPLGVCWWGLKPSVEVIPVATIAIITALIAALQERPYFRLCRGIRHFRTVTSRRVTLHYSPGLADQWDFAVLLQRCEEELDDLTRWFGFQLRRRVVVFLFASWREIARIRPRASGLALPPINAVLVGNDDNLKEVLRHELSHLFASRWSLRAPPLLQEGLAVYLQGTRMSRPIDVAAHPLLDSRRLRLARLLDRKFFFSQPHAHACYVLAGRFTGFLIRRYGWKRYRRFYRRCTGLRFRMQFLRCFGVSLEKAEWQWHNELVLMEVLNRRRRSILDL